MILQRITTPVSRKTESIKNFKPLHMEGFLVYFHSAVSLPHVVLFNLMFVPLLIIGLFLFVIGLVVGSFLNVVIYRTLNEESFVTGRSRCDHCKKTIAW